MLPQSRNFRDALGDTHSEHTQSTAASIVRRLPPISQLQRTQPNEPVPTDHISERVNHVIDLTSEDEYSDPAHSDPQSSSKTERQPPQQPSMQAQETARQAAVESSRTQHPDQTVTATQPAALPPPFNRDKDGLISLLQRFTTEAQSLGVCFRIALGLLSPAAPNLRSPRPLREQWETFLLMHSSLRTALGYQLRPNSVMQTHLITMGELVKELAADTSAVQRTQEQTRELDERIGIALVGLVQAVRWEVQEKLASFGAAVGGGVQRPRQQQEQQQLNAVGAPIDPSARNGAVVNGGKSLQQSDGVNGNPAVAKSATIGSYYINEETRKKVIRHMLATVGVTPGPQTNDIVKVFIGIEANIHVNCSTLSQYQIEVRKFLATAKEKWQGRLGTILAANG
ncbi:hypothetical protein HK097_004155, partial [Rhizophlyctis rosea]